MEGTKANVSVGAQLPCSIWGVGVRVGGISVYPCF